MATTYTVQPGDTLFLIARRFGTTVEALVQANNIADPNLIFPGQVLTIPEVVTPTPAPTVTPVPPTTPCPPTVTPTPTVTPVPTVTPTPTVTPVPTTTPCPDVNILSNPGFEDWPDPALPPTGWTGTNLFRTTLSHTGNFAAELGATHNERALLSQTVDIEAGRIYDLNWWARENIQPGNVARYVLFVEIFYYRRDNTFVGRTEPRFSQDDIPDNVYQQYTLSTGRVPAEARIAEVRFTFEPAGANTNTVKIDDVELRCRF